MEKSQTRLLQAGVLTTLYALYIPILVPALHLTWFAPLLVLLFHRVPLVRMLWIALACGLLLDLQSARPFGFFALNHVMTTALLYPQKKRFFEDSLATCSLMTFCFALLSTIVALFQVRLTGAFFPLSWKWALSDLFLMPLADALYAFLAVQLPLWWWANRPKRRPRFSRPRPK